MGRFPGDAHGRLDAIRDGHFWFEERRRFLAAQAAPLAGAPGFRGAEVGCGDGFVLGALPGRWTGVEERWEDALAARRRTGRPVAVASGERLPFGPRLSAVAAFDVLEHAEDDATLVRALAAALAPGGRLLVTVPAGPELWSDLDAYAGHYRRYTRAALVERLAGAGLRAAPPRPLFRTLRPLAWLRARLHRRVEDPSRTYGVGPVANALLAAALRLERALPATWGRGTSWFASAQK